jgi:protein gp37
MFVEEHLLDPLIWRKPRRIFVNSMSDLFHPGVTDEMLDRIFAVMALSPRHTFQVLTKRPERMQAYMTGDWGSRVADVLVDWLSEATLSSAEFAAKECRLTEPLPNCWMGVSVENQAAADERIPLLLQTPAAVRFISAEPLLGPVSISRWTGVECHHEDSYSESDTNATVCRECDESDFLDWAICGGESGPGARPMHPDWARGLRDQCVAAGVPFFFKQWGEWKGGDQHLSAGHGIKPGSVGPERVRWLQTDGRSAPCGSSPVGFELGPNNLVTRVGKKATGHLLDGVEWHQFPSPAGNPDLEAEHGRD